MSKKPLNLFATVLTYPAPAGNYRGESEDNRTILQKIAKDGQKYAVISPESMRNAIRETLITLDQPHNRTRLNDYSDNEGKSQLAVEFKEYPNPDKYADDFLFGYMIAKKEDVKKMKPIPPKRDSVFRCNMAVALSPYKHDTVFYQSPLNAGNSPWNNANNSALLHREVTHTAFQYPFALSSHDCQEKPEWVKALLEAIAQLNNVSGGHARAYYEFAPRSMVVRLTPKLVAGYNTYGFDEDGNWIELNRLGKKDSDNCDLPADEFYIGGEIIRNMEETKLRELKDMGVNVFSNCEQLLNSVADNFLA